MKIEKITYHSDSPRDLIVVDGMSFFRSSSLNTWLPCFGLFESGKERGHYVNLAPNVYLPSPVHQMLSKLCGSETATRFFNLPSVLISSQLGGGLWDTQGGKALKAYLKKMYPDFYYMWPSLTVAKEGKQFAANKIEEVNEWLSEKAGVDKYTNLPNKFVMDPDKLIADFKRKMLEEGDLEIMDSPNADKVEIKKITHTGSDDAERDLIVIDGICFYSSSGNNSSAPKTWFPVLGILESEINGDERGWYKKPGYVSAHEIPFEVSEKIKKYLDGNSLDIRFSNLPSLLISSQLGGGLWNTRGGQALKGYLKESYPDFYKKWPTLVVAPEGKHFEQEEIELVNQWLSERNGVLDKQEFAKKLNHITPPTADDDYQLTNRDADREWDWERDKDAAVIFAPAAQPRNRSHFLPGYQENAKEATTERKQVEKLENAKPVSRLAM